MQKCNKTRSNVLKWTGYDGSLIVQDAQLDTRRFGIITYVTMGTINSVYLLPA